jgi:flagellar motor switch protein FliN
MDNQGKKSVAKAFAAAFGRSLGEVLAGATGHLWPIEILNCQDTPAQKGVPVHFRLSAQGALSGECFVELYEPQIADMLSKVFKVPVKDLTDSHREGLAKFIASAAEGLVASPAGDYSELRFKVERVSGLAFGGMFVVPLATSEDNADLQILLYFGGELLDTLSLLQGSSAQSNDAKSVVAPHNLKLVMDVELNVSLRFGQRQLPLREVLGLTSGSIIELDRMADEPVELYLDGKLIARGEAVVVDGNYGLRVTEIPQPVASYLVN